MTKETYDHYQRQANKGALPDNENPIFILSDTSSKLLSKIALREIDVVELAKIELANRGQDLTGRWTGFKQLFK